ncbi:MAG: hypothetical protein IT368_09040 [Candidatus Hydrogenedentes bacterium]|nr:hypothetical protein [Candidatus Hydrogenedentota bacterium]
MRDAVEHLERIAAVARCEQAPRTGVAAAVLCELRAQAAAEERPMLIFALGSVAMAGVFAMAGLYLFDSITDPLALLFHTTPVLG